MTIRNVFDDEDAVLGLVERHAPYGVTQRYFGSNAELEVGARSTRDYGGDASGQNMFIVPLFRGEWAYDDECADGVAPVLQHPPFVDGAKRVFDAEIVRPFSVYVNLTHQLPMPQGDGHVDCPEFRGVNRSNTPMWLLAVMGMSGLFEPERVAIATAVSWFYRGEDGGFLYWPGGPSDDPKTHDVDINNSAIVGDNDRMFHLAMPVGKTDEWIMGMTLDSTLRNTGRGRWSIVEAGETLRSFTADDLRVSLSWKARVFENAREERRYLEQTDDIGIEDVWDRLFADLETRRTARPAADLQDPETVRVLGDAYVLQPGYREARR